MTAGKVKSVQWRILFRLVPLLALIFIGFLIWLGKHLQEVLYSANLELARRANLAVVYAIEATMLTDPDHNVWDEIGETVPRQDKTEVEVINSGLRVLFSTNPANQEIVHELGDASCNICHKTESSQPRVDASIVRDAGVEDYQVFATVVQYLPQD
jgi:hypothetical protein